ncbi:uncharacterized transporter slc-17.2-like [Ctenocephalides felis]|uniref:uncharacterized transporter slc-17.2-like n=1 Tax=Ctenocephalides felis TaxID=7515 RepID=UPI000E6E4378|nr:uncharacterized transporter slc-17.2-like [Ctenocephalides felis]
MDSQPSSNVEHPKSPLWGSCRLTLSVCAFLVLVNMIMTRYSLALTLICMVRTQDAETSLVILSDNNKCPNCRQEYRKYDFDWQPNVQGRLNAAIFYGFITTQPFAGYFCDRFGGKLLFVIAAGMQGICSLFCPVAARLHVEFLFVLRIIQGCFSGFTIPAMYALFSKWTPPKEKTLLLGFAYSGFPMGNIIVYPLSSALCRLDLDGGWPLVFYCIGSFAIILGILLYFLTFDDPSDHPRISEAERNYIKSYHMKKFSKKLKTPWISMLKSMPIYAYNVAHFAQSWSFITLATSIPMMLKDMLGLDMKSNGFLSALPYICSYISRFTISVTFNPIKRLTRLSLTNMRKVNHVLGTAIPALSLLCLGLITREDKFWAILLISLCTTFTDVGLTGSYLMSYLELAPPFASFLTGFSNTVGSLPGCVSNTLTGYLTTNGTREEWMVVIYIMAAMYLVGGIFYVIFGTSELQEWAIIEDNP